MSGHVLNYSGSSLDSRQCLELISWILKQAFEVDQWAIINISKKTIVDDITNKCEKAQPIVMMLKEFHRNMIAIYQNSDFDLLWMLQPEKYEKNWKILLQIAIEFITFKDQFEERHYQVEEELGSLAEQLVELSNELG